jgi:hypothetical protein
LIQIKPAGQNQADPSIMARHDWTHALTVAATLALAVGAMCILLFAM